MSYLFWCNQFTKRTWSNPESEVKQHIKYLLNHLDQNYLASLEVDLTEGIEKLVKEQYLIARKRNRTEGGRANGSTSGHPQCDCPCIHNPRCTKQQVRRWHSYWFIFECELDEYVAPTHFLEGLKRYLHCSEDTRCWGITAPPTEDRFDEPHYFVLMHLDPNGPGISSSQTEKLKQLDRGSSFLDTASVVPDSCSILRFVCCADYLRQAAKRVIQAKVDRYVAKGEEFGDRDLCRLLQSQLRAAGVGTEDL